VTAVELVGAVGAAVCGMAGSALVARQTTRQKVSEGKAAVEVAAIEADGKTEASLADVMRDILSDMRNERTALVAAAAAEAARLAARVEAESQKHVRCLELVGEATGRIEALELGAQGLELKLDDCEKKHSEAAAELATFKRSVARELSARPPSNPGFPKAGG